MPCYQKYISTFLILFFICTTGSFSPAQIKQTETSPYVSLTVMKFSDNSWSDEQINQHFQSAANVYTQCGVKFAVLKIISSKLNSKDLKRWDPYAPDGYLSFGLKAVKGISRPLVLMIGNFADTDGESTPFAMANYPTSNIETNPPGLYGTVYFPAYVNSDKYIQDHSNSPYSTLAHELLHILTLEGQHNNDPTANLLTIWQRRTNYITPEQCSSVLTSEYVNRGLRMEQ